MNIRPLADKVLVRIPSTQDRRKGNLIIPASVKSLEDGQIVGEVIAVGLGKYNTRLERREDPPDVEVGDRIIMGKYAGTRLHIDDRLHMVVLKKEILAIITKERQEPS